MHQSFHENTSAQQIELLPTKWPYFKMAAILVFFCLLVSLLLKLKIQKNIIEPWTKQ